MLAQCIPVLAQCVPVVAQCVPVVSQCGPSGVPVAPFEHQFFMIFPILGMLETSLQPVIVEGYGEVASKTVNFRKNSDFMTF